MAHIFSAASAFNRLGLPCLHMKPRIQKLQESSTEAAEIEDQPCSLEELVARITPENRHREVKTGTAVGNESW
jgi:hypothetical protein